MKIAMLDSADRDYTVQTAGREPLGGTQTAVCQVCVGLAKLGHGVTLFRGTSDAGRIEGVDHLASSTLTLKVLESLKLDVIVLISSTGEGRRIRSIMSDTSRLVLWAHIPDDQPSFAGLRDSLERDAYDGFVFVSQWQAEQFGKAFGIDLRRATILRNAAAPAFINLFAGGEPILPHKARPPVLVYTSAPNRGLNILLQAFPEIRAKFAGARLQVFSSMQLYATSRQDDLREYGHLYEQCRRTEGVEHFGAVPQPVLAGLVRQAAVLAYPNTMEEASCIAAIEAMAAGCQIVTTAGGALPETTAGFAQLIPAGLALPEYRRQFVDAAVGALRRMDADAPAVEQLLRRQREFVLKHYNWADRAGEWERWLSALPSRA